MRRSGGHRENRRLRVEGLVARALLWGGLLSISLVVLGLGVYAGHGGFHSHVLELHRAARPERHTLPPEVFVSPTEVIRGLTAHPIDPLAVIALGLVLLLVTPVVGVAVAIPGFLAVGDRRYAAIAAFVLTLLVLGALLTGGVG